MTTEADIRTRNSATSTLVFFLFIFFLSPFFFKSPRTRRSLSPTSSPPDEDGCTGMCG